MRLRPRRGELRDHPGAGDADGGAQARARFDLRARRRGDRHRGAEAPHRPGDVDVGLVDADLVAVGGDLGDELEDLLRVRGVEAVGGRDHLGDGAQAHRPGHRHRGVDAELPGLVARGDDDAAAGPPADDDGTADEFGTGEEFDGDEERVHVEVEHRRTGVVRAEMLEVTAGAGQLFAAHVPPMARSRSEPAGSAPAGSAGNLSDMVSRRTVTTLTLALGLALTGRTGQSGRRRTPRRARHRPPRRARSPPTPPGLRPRRRRSRRRRSSSPTSWSPTPTPR